MFLRGRCGETFWTLAGCRAVVSLGLTQLLGEGTGGAGFVAGLGMVASSCFS